MRLCITAIRALLTPSKYKPKSLPDNPLKALAICFDFLFDFENDWIQKMLKKGRQQCQYKQKKGQFTI
jgi:hypothetical protein